MLTVLSLEGGPISEYPGVSLVYLSLLTPQTAPWWSGYREVLIVSPTPPPGNS